MPRSKAGASKSRPRWAAHSRIGNVWEYPHRGRIERVPSAFGVVKGFYLLAHLLIFSVVPREIVDHGLCKILRGKQGVTIM